MKLYKILGPDRMPIHGGRGRWPEPGVWTAPQQVIPCRNGYHLCTVENIPAWLADKMELWEAEGSGETVTAGDKVVYEQARLIRKLPEVTDRLLRLFAADCAERVLSIYEQQYPGDGRPRAAIQAARDYAEGKIGAEELRAAAEAAWRAAAWTAAGAARAARAAGAAITAAGDAEAAARAAITAAGDAPQQERLWQGNHFLELLNGT